MSDTPTEPVEPDTPDVEIGVDTDSTTVTVTETSPDDE